VIFALIMDKRTVSRDADFATESAGLDTKTGTDFKSVPSPYHARKLGKHHLGNRSNDRL
jgi:hypothetical protein